MRTHQCQHQTSTCHCSFKSSVNYHNKAVGSKQAVVPGPRVDNEAVAEHSITTNTTDGISVHGSKEKNKLLLNTNDLQKVEDSILIKGVERTLQVYIGHIQMLTEFSQLLCKDVNSQDSIDC